MRATLTNILSSFNKTLKNPIKNDVKTCVTAYIHATTYILQAATRGVLCKKLFLEISQNSQENTCARVSFLIKLQALG